MATTTTAGRRRKAAKDLASLLPSKIARTFRLMGVAEEEIREAMDRHPGKTAVLDRAFGLLVPTGFAGYDECVYRHHCRELLDRVARGQDTGPGTRAECMLALSEASLRAPLEQGYQAVFERLFGEVMGEEALDALGYLTHPPREAWKGQGEEILFGLRRAYGKARST